jgi:hypothetical protein
MSDLRKLSSQSHHLGSDYVSPCHKEGILPLLAVDYSSWYIVNSHVGLVEHVTICFVSVE